MKMYRLMGILLLLENNPMMTAKALAEHFEVSVRTIYRDLDVLSEAGFSIVTESGPGGGVSLMNAKRIQISAMDENELLQIIHRFTAKEKGDECSENMALKIRSQLPVASQSLFDKLSQATLIDSKNWFGMKLPIEAHLLQIQKCILSEQKMVIDYESNKRHTSDRIVHPLGIAKKNQQWYMVAYCELRCEYRVFSVSKIMKLVVLDEKYNSHKRFNLGEFWNKAIENFGKTEYQGSMGTIMEMPDLYPVKVIVSEHQSRALSGFNRLKSSTPYTVYEMINEQIAFNQLLVISDEIEIIEPEALRLKILEHAKKVIQKYEK